MCTLRTYWPEYLHLWNWGLTPSLDLISTWEISPKWFHTWWEMVLPVKMCELVSISEQHWQQEARWQQILLWMTKSVGIKSCHNLQLKKETVVGVMELRISRYECWDYWIEWTFFPPTPCTLLLLQYIALNLYLHSRQRANFLLSNKVALYTLHELDLGC